MKGVELYGRVRYAVQIEGLSHREAARRFGIDPRTVAKMMVFSVPPGYRRSRPPARPKLDPFIGIIERIREPPNGLRSESNSRHEASYRHRSLEIKTASTRHHLRGVPARPGPALDPVWDVEMGMREAKGQSVDPIMRRDVRRRSLAGGFLLAQFLFRSFIDEFLN